MLLSIILSSENPIFTISIKQKGKKNKQITKTTTAATNAITGFRIRTRCDYIESQKMKRNIEILVFRHFPFHSNYKVERNESKQYEIYADNY